MSTLWVETAETLKSIFRSLSLSLSRTAYSPLLNFHQKNPKNKTKLYVHFSKLQYFSEWINRNQAVNLSEEKIKDPTERHRLYKQQSAQRFSDFYFVITVKRT